MDLPPPSFMTSMSKILLISLVILAEVFGIVSVVLVGVWMGHYSTPGFQWSPFGKLCIHPFVMTLGMVFTFGNATLTYRVLGRFDVRRKVIKTIHGSLMTVVIACTALGIYLVVSSILGKSFKSVHAMMGIATTCLFVLQFICAVCIFVFPCAPEWLRALYMREHAFFGIVTLVAAMTTCLTGIGIGQSLFGGNTWVSLSSGMFISAFCTTIAYILTKESFRVTKPHHSLLNNNQ